MTGPLRVHRCAICNRPRRGDTWALGLEALLGEDRVAWLCQDCEALPGRAWAFIDAVRGLYPEAVIASTTAPAGVVTWAPLVLATEVEAASGRGPLPVGLLGMTSTSGPGATGAACG